MNVSGLRKLPNGKGGYGECYILDNDTLYKRFYKLSDGSYPFDCDYFEKFIGMNNDVFVFPRNIDIEGNYTVGYTMDYIHSDTLEDLDFDFSIDDFVLALDKLNEGLYEVTNQGIVVLDVNAKNMLYDGEDFHVIDTDLYITRDETDFVPEEVNEDYVASYLYSYITQEKRPHEIKKVIERDYGLTRLDKALSKNARIADLKTFVYGLKDEVEMAVGHETESFSDLYEAVDKIR